MELILGLDGGGTHTTACLTDTAGLVVGRAEAGMGNANHASDAELKAHFGELLGKLLGPLGASPEDIVSVFAGVAGVTSEPTAARVRDVLTDCGLGPAIIGIDHDIRVALAGGLSGRPGIALIVGTGSSCYGRDLSGSTWQTGGWGSLIADEGSGYYLGREAMSAAARMADGRQHETKLKLAVFDWLGISDVSEILERIYGRELCRQEIAAFAPALVQLAQSGDPAAHSILTAGAQLLAEMVAANHARLPTAESPEVVITGGLGTAPTCYKDLIIEAIGRELPAAKVVPAELDAARGAAMLALQQWPGAMDAETLRNLKGSS